MIRLTRSLWRSVVANSLILFAGWHRSMREPDNPTIELERQSVSVPNITPKIKKPLTRRKQLLADNPYCTYCGCKVNRHSASLDHVWPKSKGGPSTEANLKLCCNGCNGDKADSTLTAWREELTLRLEALQAINPRDTCHEMSLRKDYLFRVLAKLDVMINGGVGSQPPEPVELVNSPPPQTVVYPKFKSGKLVKNEDFISGPYRFAIINGASGELLLSDSNIQVMSDYLLSGTFDPDNPVRFVRYQEFFNPNWNVPDWREHRRQHYSDYRVSKANPVPDNLERDTSEAIAPSVDA